jgi:hypothetical protein
MPALNQLDNVNDEIVVDSPGDGRTSHGTLANNDAGGTDTTRSPSTEVADRWKSGVEEWRDFYLPSKDSRPNGVTENDHELDY